MAEDSDRQSKSLLLSVLFRLTGRALPPEGAVELAECDRLEVERMARELGLSARDIEDIAARGAQGADLLYERLGTLGIGRADVERLGPQLMPDLEHNCCGCQDKGACSQDLVQGSDDPRWREYCPNATTLDALSAMKGRFPA